MARILAHHGKSTTDLNALTVVDTTNHLDAHLRDLFVFGLLDADVTEYLDDALANTYAYVQNAVAEHAVILIDEVGTVEDELADQLDGGLPH